MIYDVAVVGGGPTGSQVAFRLAALGYGVALLERRKAIGEKASCTGIVGQECVEAFEIDKEVILREVSSATLYSPSGNCLQLRRDETQAYILDRTAFNQYMARRAQDKGAEYHFGTPAENVEADEDKVTIKTARGNLEAKAMVLAPGFGSVLTERLGKFGDSTAGAQADVDSTVHEVEVYFGREVAPGFFAWLVPASPGKARVGLLSRRHPAYYLRKFLASLAAAGKIASPDVAINRGAVPLRPLPRTFSDRLLVVGDAAGHVKPTTGGGIYYGLLSADIVAQTLHQALQSGDLSAQSLARYEREWKRLLGQELRTGYWARRLFEKLSDRQIDRIFDVVKRNGIDAALLRQKDLSFDWHSKAIRSLLPLLVKDRVIAHSLNVLRLPRKLTGSGLSV